MNEEIVRILRMVEEGKLTAEKAKELIDALGKVDTVPAVYSGNYVDKFLRVKILSKDGDKVNVQLPIKVIKELIKITGKLPINIDNMQGINIEEIMNTIVACLDSEMMGEIVDISSADGDTIKVVIE